MARSNTRYTVSKKRAWRTAKRRTAYMAMPICCSNSKLPHVTQVRVKPPSDFRQGVGFARFEHGSMRSFIAQLTLGGSHLTTYSTAPNGEQDPGDRRGRALPQFRELHRSPGLLGMTGGVLAASQAAQP